MELWYPPKDRPHLLEWWRPLILASAAARRGRFPWPVHIDEMTLVGRIDRSSRPAIWVYRHPASRGELYVDATGQAYTFTKTPKGRSLGRFSPCEISAALWRAGLPTVVEPIWYDEPPARHPGWTSDVSPEREDVEPQPAEPEPRRRGHLTIYDGGRPMAG
jgi:hypothetical protein